MEICEPKNISERKDHRKEKRSSPGRGMLLMDRDTEAGSKWTGALAPLWSVVLAEILPNRTPLARGW